MAHDDRVKLTPVTTFDELPLDLRTALALAERETATLSDVYSQSMRFYILTMSRAIARNPHDPWHAIYCQLTYILSSAHMWKTEGARSAKVIFRRYTRAYEQRKRNTS